MHWEIMHMKLTLGACAQGVITVLTPCVCVRSLSFFSRQIELAYWLVSSYSSRFLIFLLFRGTALFTVIL